MADVTNPVFNKAAADKLRSPDDLELYIRVTNPSVLAVLVASVFLVAGLLAWGIFGTVTTSVHAMGTVMDGQPACFLSREDVEGVERGDTVNFGGRDMKVSGVAKNPLSRAEAHDLLGNDYLASVVVLDDWVYVVDFEGDVSGFEEYVPQPADITTERIAPISLILRSRE